MKFMAKGADAQQFAMDPGEFLVSSLQSGNNSQSWTESALVL